MPRFVFQARDRSGRTQAGVMEQASFENVVDALRRREWLVLDVQQEGQAAEAPGWASINLSSLLPVRLLDIEVSLRQLAVMLRSGLTLLDALRMLCEQSHRASMQKVWEIICQDILNGESLGISMERQKCFPNLVIHLTRVGEQTGELDLVLSRAADTIENWRKLRSQIMTAMAYPLVVFIAAVGVAAFMVFHVIPKIQQFLSGMGKSLPAMTQALVDITQFCNDYVWHGLAILVISITAFIVLRMSPRGRWWTDRVFLRMPILGGALRTAGSLAFARNISTLLNSGVSLLESLKSIEQLLSNKYLASIVEEARDRVVQGRTLADALKNRNGFSPMLCRMAAIGESSGRLDEIMAEAARFYDDELQRSIRRLAALVEPAMLLIVGGIVGFVYISFFMALFAAARG